MKTKINRHAMFSGFLTPPKSIAIEVFSSIKKGTHKSYYSAPLLKFLMFFTLGMVLLSSCSKFDDLAPASGDSNINENSTKATGATFYLAPNGSDAATGDISHPFATLTKAWSLVSAGSTIYLRGGTYNLTSTSNQSIENKSGTAGNLIKIWAYPGETPVFNYSSYTPPTYATAFKMTNCNYVHVKGLRVTNLTQPSNGLTCTGIQLMGSSNCIVENSTADHIGGYGFDLRVNNITGVGSSNNLILNCDAHHNADPNSNPAYDGSNGFGCYGGGTPENTSTNNTFRGCRAWWNSDDGFDFYGHKYNTVLDNCWSFWNGYIPGTFTSTAPGGDGDGFKLGPNPSEPNTIRKTLTNCLSFENRLVGFQRNGGQQAYCLYNNVAYKNVTGGYYFDGVTGVHNIFKNNISYSNTGYNSYINAESTVDHNTFLSGTSQAQNSAFTVSNSDFASISSVGMDGPRQADGSLPVLPFLHLATGSDLINAGVNVGLPFSGSAPDVDAFESSASGGGSGNLPPVIQNQTFLLNRNSSNGTSVGTVVASDPDAGQTLTYSILSGNTNGAFAINSSTGGLTVANSSALTSTGGTNYSVFQPTTPTISQNYIGNGTAPLEMGMKFRSSVNGYISGFRFYKGAGAQGTHIGHLWNINGISLASATFTGETSSGWQTVTLSTPVAITANTVYVVSYFSQHGDFAKTTPYFTADIVNGPLTRLGWTASQPNGIYKYASAPAFPNVNAYIGSTNYWADVIFTTAPTLASFALVVKVVDNGTGSLSNQAAITVNLN